MLEGSAAVSPLYKPLQGPSLINFVCVSEFRDCGLGLRAFEMAEGISGGVTRCLVLILRCSNRWHRRGGQEMLGFLLVVFRFGVLSGLSS